jgi:hypothetical protein
MKHGQTFSTPMTMMPYVFTRHSKASAAIVAMVALTSLSICEVEGFSGCARFIATSVTTATSHSFHQHVLNYYNHQYHPLLARSEEGEFEDFEPVRQELEMLIMASKDALKTSAQTHRRYPFVKPLTSSSKRLMELELELLKKLEESDDVVDPLVELWTAERADAAKDLQEMELGNCSPGLVQEEARLRAMIQRYGSEWVEPMSRLAVLLFTKGRLVEAIGLIRNVLQVKPWHFEAGQLLVIILLRNGEYASAIRAARVYTLPDLNENTQNRRRMRWVNEKVAQAQEILRHAVEATSIAVLPDVTSECPVDEPYCWQ